MLAVVVDHRNLRAGGGVEITALDQQLGEAEHCRERGAQFVADIGEKDALGPARLLGPLLGRGEFGGARRDLLLQPFGQIAHIGGHHVEGRGQHADLVVIGDRQRGAQVAGGDAAHTGQQVGQRADQRRADQEHVPGQDEQQPGEGHGHQERSERGEPLPEHRGVEADFVPDPLLEH